MAMYKNPNVETVATVEQEAKVFIEPQNKPVSRIELIVKKEILYTMASMLRGMPHERLDVLLSQSIDIVRDQLTDICNKQL